MNGKRTYGDMCGIARALDLVGERWALLVVRELIYGPKRFTDLRRSLPNIGPDVLTQRLRDLERAEVLRKRTLDPPAAVQVYELTERGRALEPVLLELGRWGAQAPFPPGDAVFGADSFVLALRTVFDPTVAGDHRGSYELDLRPDRFTVAIGAGTIDIVRGAGEDADARLVANTGTLAALLWRGRTIDDALASGDLEIEGSKRAATTFLGLFAAPAHA
jgi:DNA-binding HxlR family transcriptional regulator